MLGMEGWKYKGVDGSQWRGIMERVKWWIVLHSQYKSDNEDELLLATRVGVLLLLLTKEACLCGNSQYSLPDKSDI
jgi:hypothetical protein